MTCTGLQEVPLGLHLSYVGYEPLYLPLNHLPCRRVVRSLAIALVGLSNADGPVKAPWTAKAYRNAISQFARWLHERGFYGDVSDISISDLYEFGLDRDPQIEGNLRALLRATVTAGVAQPVHDDLLEHLDGRRVAPRRRSAPLPAYSAGEQDRLVKVCRAVIGASDAASRLTGPDLSVALAFRILLGLELGLPASSLTNLTVTGVRWQGERDVRVEFTKPRANGAQAMHFRLRGPWSGPALLQRWLNATEPLRANTNEHAERVWLYADGDGRVRSATFAGHPWDRARRAFVAVHRLRDDDGHALSLDMRRLRTTWVVRRSKHWHGAVTVDPNHTATVEGDRYLTRSADRDEVAAVVEAAQGDLLRRVEHLALLIAPDEELADHVDSPAGNLARQAAGGSAAPWDMFVAACRDPFDSPFTTKGSFCTAAVWSCIVCPLAVITPSKLPALLRLRDFLEVRSAEVSSREWMIGFAPAWVQLTTRILPRFDDATLAAARAAVDANEDLPMPIEPLWSS